ncbi:O-acetyl-ADP-ribose deacetylase [Neolewinella persica]|uniref:O-acetyl-ADP-ribose deacetylase n=1 Tax=Neolewinella persica TaxID=70998 RepID=UPI00037C14EB|nr:O-acetyl-ADP-ribose deacetylase [Neolewinella persica]
MIITLQQGDITKLEVDAIVNAANTSLLGGGGVDGAIHRAGGPTILDDCMKIRARQGGCKVGEAVVTSAGNLPCKHIIHTVGPRWNEGNSDETTLLANCYHNVLRLAQESGSRKIAIPNISTGIYRFPKEAAAAIALKAVNSYEGDLPEEVVFVCFDDENYNIYQRHLK